MTAFLERFTHVDRSSPRTKSVRNHSEDGMALITALLILLLLSAMTVGIAWLVSGDQKLGGNNEDRQLAFYGAEAGMESLTASLENLFDQNYAPNATAINNLMVSPGPPTNIPNVQYIAPGETAPGSGYQITFTPTPGNANLPATNWGTIPTGTYAGLVGLMTPYTLTVTARTQTGSEARLQREVQTVAIPIFQFGFFSQMDLAFFAGPNFNFGGRVHTNGNLWLAEGNGNSLTLTQKVTAAGEIVSENLENGWQTTTNYNGAVNITNGSGVSNLIAQTPPQSVVGNTNYYQNIGAYNTAFAGMANSVYNNNIQVAQTGVQPLNLSIATPAIGGQPIDLVRWPQPGEATSNPGKLQERYYSQVSLRILLADYGPDGTCATSAISSTAANPLPYIAANVAAPTATPVDLATLAWTQNMPGAIAGNGYITLPYYSPPPGITAANVGSTIFPLPASNAQGASPGYAYQATDGYWVQNLYPTINGCLKIDYQSNTSTTGSPVWTDVTWEILNLGFTGRNINPQSAATMSNTNNQSPYIVPLPNSQVGAQGPTAHSGITPVCSTDPSPNAVIRLARVRDNPSSANNVGGCGTMSATTPASDFWPNVLFDTREAVLQDSAPPNNGLPLAGAMHYVELDVKNLAKWFTGAIGTSGTRVLATNGYSVYFSDRRGEQADPNPPASVSAASALTGGFGYEDIVNNYGCPNGVLDQGEDIESDYVNGVSQSPILRTFGNVLANLNSSSPSNPSMLWRIKNTALSGSPITGTELGGIVASPGTQVYTLVNSVLNAGYCGTTYWPHATAVNGRDLRENPPIFFRRALKLVDADTISLGTCNSVPCGLTTVSENPVYVQGCFNNPGECAMTAVNWSPTSVATSVIADAVTLLSDNWNDVNSFASPYNTGNRTGGTTTFRMAIAAGKGVPFKQPTNGGPPQDFGTDGGAHNFLRFLENWGGTLYYEGSIVSMYYNHQAEGIYKCCNTVYSPPTRGYQFDTNFLTPSLLPPLTPMLRVVNTIGFSQILLPTE
jgi:PilX N-terminal